MISLLDNSISDMNNKKPHKKNLFLNKRIITSGNDNTFHNQEFILDFDQFLIGFNQLSFNYNYREYLPPNDLRDCIKHYWFLEINNPTEQERYQELLPRAEYEMLIVYKDPFIDSTNKSNKKLVGTMINGINSSRRVFRATGEIGIFGICFKPYAMRMLLKTPVKNLAEKYTMIEKAPQLFKELSSQLISGKHFEKMKITNDFLYSIFFEKNKNRVKFPIQEIINDINHNKGSLIVDKITEKYSCSRSKLERNFADYIGITPKKYCRLIRFKNALLNYVLGMDIQDIIFHLGFYDQSHLINEFQKYLGKSPVKYIHKKKQEIKVLFNDPNILHSYVI